MTRTKTTSTRELRVPTEREWTQQVIGLARLCGYLVYHTWLSVRSAPGFPDLVLVRPASDRSPGRIIYAELKSSTGRITPAQEHWLETLRSAGQEVHVWRPGQAQEIADVLMGSTACQS